MRAVTAYVCALIALVAGCGDDAGGGTAPAAPTGLTASDGELDAVAITWTAAEGATSYRVLRDGVAIIEIEMTAFTDDSATPGEETAPTLSATQGTHADRVDLTWTASTLPGDVHTYTVVAINAAGESPPSASDEGHRGPPMLIGYQLSIDGGAFFPVGGMTTYSDLTAPAATITPPTVSASDGAFSTHVALSLSSVTSQTTPRSYVVRAETMDSFATSNTATGHRGIGMLSYEWRREGDVLVGANAATFNDTFVPAGRLQYFTCAITATGAPTVYTVPDSGWRSATTNEISRDTWIADGNVNSVATGNGRIYLGGSFNYVGPPTGSFVALDATSAAPDQTRARVVGVINVAIGDGNGGWYIGGTLASIDGAPREAIAHLDAAGQLDEAFAPDLRGTVHALALTGTTLYVGFSQGLRAVDVTTGTVTTWNPNVQGKVRALAVIGSTLYVGGEFENAGGQARHNLAALDTATAAATSWNPQPDGYVISTMAISGSSILVGGSFTMIGGQARNHIAALDTTGAATAWNPNAGGYVAALAVSSGTIYVGGQFATIGGQTRPNLAAINASTGAATTWNPAPDQTVFSLGVAGGTLYIAGMFSTVDGQPRRQLAAINTTTGAVTAWAPTVPKQVNTITPVGSTVFVGGDFMSIGGQYRDGLAALDATTGVLTAWDPGANNDVISIVASGNTIYVAGIFSTIAGQTTRFLAAVDGTTGALLPWTPAPSAGVYSLALSGTTLYAGGLFTTIGGQTRVGIAALDTTTAAATAWNPGANGIVVTLALGGTTLYAGGQFTMINGQARAGLAAIDTTTGVATAWNPAPNDRVESLAVSGSTVYVGGRFTAIGGQPRNLLAAIESTSGLATTWNPSISGNNVEALAVSGNIVYAGGDGITAFDATTAAPTVWHPAAVSIEGSNGAFTGSVYALLVAGSTLYIVGGFTSMAGHLHAGLAICPTL